ncbi:MAG: 16S rRNA (cytidine(1402)-2'-O)-methyltransferase [Candidatus Omnitrophica bacterium]|nr:16S rRNA (cytidine(1402)-2'-O)-methyltransferase [Candidatus Omnitrophota bacterium]
MLYLVPTPIGNLKDITLRALEVLKSADCIACEDTRRTGQLLKHHSIPAPRLISFHDHSSSGRVREIISLLKEGKNVAFVTDGGTPLISDPGFPLIREAIREGIPIEALPGPTAVTTALAVSGLPTEKFVFFGFLPQKSGPRKKELQKVKEFEETLVFFESPHRIVAALREMREIFGDREAAVCRELTKKFEEVKRGTLNQLSECFAKKKPLGEIVIVIAGKGRKKVFSPHLDPPPASRGEERRGV